MLSSYLPPKQQHKKKKVNQCEHRRGRGRPPLEKRERMALVMMRYGGGGTTGSRGSPSMMKFFPQIYVKLTTCNTYLKNSKAKPRLKWERQLQERFVQSVDALGGEQYATPKKILYMMNAIGLTLSHLKSHLQKYRIAIRAPPRRSRINRKKKTNSVEHGESSCSTKKCESNNSKGKEPAISSMAASSFAIARSKTNRGNKSETQMAGFIFQAKNSYPIHCSSREQIIVQSYEEQFPYHQPVGQYSFSKNLYSAPDSKISFEEAGGSRRITGNYQTNIGWRIHNTSKSGSKPVAVHNSSALGLISSRISGFPSMMQNPMGAVDPPSDLNSNFPSMMEKVMEQSSSLTSIAMGGLGWCFPNPYIHANSMRSGSNFLPVVALRSEMDSRYPLIIPNPWSGSNLYNSRVVVTPTEPSSENTMKLDSSILSILSTSRTDMEPDSSFTVVADTTESEFESIFSSTVPNANTIGPGTSSSLTLNENLMQPSGSSFSSMVENPMDSGTGTTLSSTHDNSMYADFSSSVLETPDENITADFGLNSFPSN